MNASRAAPALPEVTLYEPVKALLEAQGYEVKGEIVGCDVVGVRGDEPPVVVELKRTFGLALVFQGLDRLTMTDTVYLAVGAWPRRPGRRPEALPSPRTWVHRGRPRPRNGGAGPRAVPAAQEPSADGQAAR